MTQPHRISQIAFPSPPGGGVGLPPECLPFGQPMVRYLAFGTGTAVVAVVGRAPAPKDG